MFPIVGFRVVARARHRWSWRYLAEEHPPIGTPLGHDATVHHPRIRVAAYVIRYRTTPLLLVFDHVGLPEAGTQIPAGGVHPGEALDTAVLREVAEETGLTNVSIADRIAVDAPPRRRARPRPRPGRPRARPGAPPPGPPAAPRTPPGQGAS
ncbi:NUDIX domain-containing protein, partial [Nocardia cyriacigeorgica]|uniref:NUDIX domain-containing protein n=1 Tax=Nocardia cyriacigeorgica TaxID=135487 RepID=UPI002455CF0E